MHISSTFYAQNPAFEFAHQESVKVYSTSVVSKNSLRSMSASVQSCDGTKGLIYTKVVSSLQ